VKSSAQKVPPAAAIGGPRPVDEPGVAATPRSTDLFTKARQFTRPQEIQAAGLYPYFVPVYASGSTEVIINGKRGVMVGSNNYLGLSHDPRVIAAAQAATAQFGTACTGSRFLNGNTELHERIEHRLAKLTKKEAALVFSTGFQTNLGVISALVGRDDSVFVDKLDHASVVDGCRLAAGETVRFRHGDLDDLENKLRQSDSNGKLVVVDGVFSMEGDIVDLPGLAKLRARYDFRLAVDDAHALGVLGDTGAGTAEHFGLIDQTDLIIGTFSKSFASIGGFVAGELAVINYLKHHSRSLIFSASMPPSACAAVLASIDILEQEPERRLTLWKNAARMKEGLRSLGFDTGGSETPIVPVVVGDDLLTFEFWRQLYDNGVFTNAVVAPAVPPHASRIRTSYSATHTPEQLDFVLEVFARVGKELGFI
jgi:8-amino-7-oxononanoate synthase